MHAFQILFTRHERPSTCLTLRICVDAPRTLKRLSSLLTHTFHRHSDCHELNTLSRNHLYQSFGFSHTVLPWPRREAALKGGFNPTATLQPSVQASSLMLGRLGLVWSRFNVNKVRCKSKTFTINSMTVRRP